MLLNPELLRTDAYIGGGWTPSDSGDRFEVRNPANGLIVAYVADCGASETNRAIDAAEAALPVWRALTAKERSNILRRWFAALIANQDDLARILTAEQGKVLSEARGEIAYSASYLEWFSEEAKRIYGDVIAPPSPDKRIVVIKQPVGVVASITPWNFPIAMAARKVAAALAAGCTFVAKPAEDTPISLLAFAYLGEKAGIPPGVFNVICGRSPKAIGEALTKNPKVRKVTFTGSTATGKLLVKQSAETMKKTTMELGGNAPFIVFEDADLDAAVAGAMASKFRNAGQTCVCTNRFIVQSLVHDEFVKRLSAAMSSFHLGDGSDPTTTMGPLIHEGAVEKAETLVQDALREGADLKMGGKRSDLGTNFYEPTLLTKVKPEMLIAREEIFGPVATVLKFETEEEAVSIANDTPYGLAAYFYTQNHNRIWRMGEALEYGMVGINEGLISNEMAPFGGIKESGSGREGSLYGIDDYVEIKYLCLGGIE